MMTGDAVRQQLSRDRTDMLLDVPCTEGGVIDAVRCRRVFHARVLCLPRVGCVQLRLELRRSFAKIMALTKNSSPADSSKGGGIAFGHLCDRS